MANAKSRIVRWGALALTLLFFVFISQLTQEYSGVLSEIKITSGATGMAIYVLVVIASIVVAPLSSFPLLPVAVTLWGPFTAAVLSIIAWTIGAIGAYILAHKIGKPLVRKFIDLDRASEIAKIVTDKKPFWTILWLRMIIPVDVLSYALGLLVPIPMRTYIIATFIGVSPFAFVFAYASNFSLSAQLVSISLILVFIAVAYRRIAEHNKGGNIVNKVEKQ